MINKKTKIATLLVVFLLIFIAIASKDKAIKNNTINTITEEYEKCERNDYLPRKKFPDWETYFNDQYYFSMQYPKNWQVVESLEHIDPYIYFSDETINKTDISKKIVINIYNQQSFSNFSATRISAFIDPQLSSFWQGAQPGTRIKGYIKETEILKKLKIPYTYNDIIIMPREGKYNDNLFFVISYNEKEFSEADREIFNKMYESFNMIDF